MTCFFLALSCCSLSMCFFFIAISCLKAPMKSFLLSTISLHSHKNTWKFFGLNKDHKNLQTSSLQKVKIYFGFISTSLHYLQKYSSISENRKRFYCLKSRTFNTWQIYKSESSWRFLDWRRPCLNTQTTPLPLSIPKISSCN